MDDKTPPPAGGAYAAVSLSDVIADLKTKAAGDAGRAAHTLFGGRDHRLRQTVIVMRGGHELSEHESPGDAALHVLEGSVSLHWADDGTAALSAGQVMAIPLHRHSLTAEEDSVVVLTVALHNDWSGQE
ncbi:MAG: LuxR family transcriptional regulator [Nocardioidaceae bacterium]